MKKIILVILLAGSVVILILLAKKDPDLPVPAPSAVAPAQIPTIAKNKPETSGNSKTATQLTQAERLELVRQRAQEAKRLDQEKQNAQEKGQNQTAAPGSAQGGFKTPDGVTYGNVAVSETLARRPPQWFSTNVAAADSIEGQLRSQGKSWIPVQGQITEGSYVKDSLEGRFGQPEGRGAIGKVLEIKKDDNGRKVAIVDFGRGFSPGIFFEELSPVNLQ